MKVYGLQQLGLGVADLEAACNWYARHLGFTAAAFDDDAPATDMAPFMGGQAREKRAVLLMHPSGGGGLEIWQHTARMPTALDHQAWGQPGINAAGIVRSSPTLTLHHLLQHGAALPTFEVPDRTAVCDPWGNLLILELGDQNAGIRAVYLGTSSQEACNRFLASTGLLKQADHTWVPAGPSAGKFGRFLGDFRVEVVEREDAKALPALFADRYWGDCGWIHWCLDVGDLSALAQYMEDQVAPFKVLVDHAFEMGQARGKWGYLSCPDGTLLECVETLAVPLLPTLGLNWNFTPQTDKPVPAYMVRAFMRSNRWGTKKQATKKAPAQTPGPL